MRLPPTLLLTLSTTTTATALPLSQTPIPVPSITNLSYAGSACPSSGLSYTFPPPPSNSSSASPSKNTTSTPLTFTLSNFAPTYSSFGSSLRMCNVIASISVPVGWKAIVNAGGTVVSGKLDVPEGTRVYWRGSWAWSGDMGSQSIGMFDTPGPLAGLFTHLLTPVEGSDAGVASECVGGEQELDVEFQARAVNGTDGFDIREMGEQIEGEGDADAAWTLTTDVEVVRC